MSNSWGKGRCHGLDNEDHVILNNVKGNVVGLSPVLDYMHRPAKYKDMTLYDWVRCCSQVKNSKGQKQAAEDDGDLVR